MNRLLNTKEACEYMNICKNTLYELVKQGKIKCYKITPKLWRFKLEDLIPHM
ncbi:MAG: helix-turn-helix domain-containing protein [Monoglobaceae bacterium]